MIDLLIAYGFFLLKIITVLAVILIPIMVIVGSTKHKKETDKGRIIVKNLSDKLEEIGVSLKSAEMDPKAYNYLNKFLVPFFLVFESLDSDSNLSVFR